MALLLTGAGTYLVGGLGPAAAFLARTSGLDTTHINAYTNLINGLVADGVWSKLDVLHIYATQDSTTALLNLVSASYNGITHGTPTFTANQGFLGVNASNTVWIDTQFNPATATSPQYIQNSAHLSSWSLTNATSLYNSIGSADASSGSVPTQAIFERYTDNNAYFRINVTAGGGPGTVSDALGHFVGVRDTSTTIQGYKNAVSVYAGTSQTSVTPRNSNIYTLAVNADAPASPPIGTAFGAGRQIAVASIGGSLSPTDVTNFYNRLSTYMTAVSGGGTTTWDPATVVNGALSNSNLTYTQTTASDGGVRATVSKGVSTGKFYFEALWTGTNGAVDTGIGICIGSAVLTNIAANALNAATVFASSGNLWINGTNVRSSATSVFSTPQTIGVAVDLSTTTGKIWVTSNGSTWSAGSGTPAAGTGGDVFTAMTGPYFPFVIGTGTLGDVWVANFSGTGLTFGGGLPPTGFTGWF